MIGSFVGVQSKLTYTAKSVATACLATREAARITYQSKGSSLLTNDILHDGIAQVVGISPAESKGSGVAYDTEKAAEPKSDPMKVPDNIARGKDRVPYNLKVGDKIHDAWTVDEIREIPAFKVTAYRTTHDKTGAKHIHLDCQDTDNTFAVLFRTPPDDNTGKPHILEHLSTCGSETYPVRDPFF